MSYDRHFASTRLLCPYEDVGRVAGRFEDPLLYVLARGGGPAYDYLHAPHKWHDFVAKTRILAKVRNFFIATWITPLSWPHHSHLERLAKSLGTFVIILNPGDDYQLDLIYSTEPSMSDCGHQAGTIVKQDDRDVRLRKLFNRARMRDRMAGTNFLETYPQAINDYTRIFSENQ